MLLAPPVRTILLIVQFLIIFWPYSSVREYFELLILLRASWKNSRSRLLHDPVLSSLLSLRIETCTFSVISFMKSLSILTVDVIFLGDVAKRQETSSPSLST